MNFDEEYFNTIGYKNYRNYPHFRQRAEWIKNNLSGGILEIGCAYGFLIEELNKLGIMIGGIDISEYAISQASILLKDQVKVSSASVIINYYDWIISWNVLDCLDSESHAKEVADVMNAASNNQLHIISMIDLKEKYTNLGYFIRDAAFWKILLPNAVLVDCESGAVYNPTAFKFSQIPLHTGKGASD